MEILIPGLILVALMVYASTRIKRSVARAFEAENIDLDQFSLFKPDGFLHVINGDPEYAFQAYSKEFGEGNASSRRQATIDLRIVTDKDFDEVCSAVKQGGTQLAERSFHIDDMHAMSAETERTVGEFPFIDHYFVIDAPGGVFELRSAVLKKYNDQISPKIDQIEESLTIKKT